MEELNNNLEGTIIEVEPVEILEETEETVEVFNKNLAIAVAITGIVASGYGIKKLWNKIKTKKHTSTVTVKFEDKVEDQPEELKED